MRSRRVLLQFNDVLLRIRRALLLTYQAYCDSTLLVLNETSLKINIDLLPHFVSWEPEGCYRYTKPINGDSTLLVLNETSMKYKSCTSFCQFRARRALLQFSDVLLRTRRVLLLYKVHGNSTLLVLNGTSLNCNLPPFGVFVPILYQNASK